ncbi:MAG: tetraacyldisaccharide 4'-kinase [Acidobacteria bacterium]|nr:tetraacyldisaccharide 4'-kinase [Acidobacteriota bacterium]
MSPAFPLSILTSGAASLWTAGSWMRAWLYRSGLFRQRSLQASVLSIGNISWGGTGKTPFTIWLAGRLQTAGLRVSILTRGYRRASTQPLQILPPGASPQDAVDSGDEVQLYLRHLNLPVGVSASRYEAGRLVEEEFSVDLHLLDDGFQHLALKRTLDLVLVDAENPWGARPGFSRLLREGASALGRADGILLTRCELAASGADNSADLENLKATVRRLNPRAQCFTLRTKLLHFTDARNADRVPLADFFPRRPMAFCGIGNPRSFFLMLEMAGIETVGSKTFPDHHRYNDADLELLRKLLEANRADCLLTTEKDIVNLPEMVSRIPLYWAAIEPVVDEEARLVNWIWEELGLPRKRSPLPASISERS